MNTMKITWEHKVITIGEENSAPAQPTESIELPKSNPEPNTGQINTEDVDKW